MKKSVFALLALILAIVVVAPASAQSDEQDEAFVKVEQMPTFEGGNLLTFRNWVMSQIRYPQIAVENNISGRVLVSFVIEKDGSLSNILVLQTPHSSLSDEVVRVLKKSPKWVPGKQKDKLVRVKYTLPVHFNLEGNTPTIGDERIIEETSGNVVGFFDSEKKHGLVVSAISFDGDWTKANEWVKSLGKGWRLPYIDELLYIYQSKGKFVSIKRMEKLLKSTCWSVAECNAESVYVVDMSTGRTSTANKKSKIATFAVVEF